MNARCLMVQGCTSDAGKSTLVAGLCRLYARRGHHIAPFKPQNMALNSAVTEDGGEVGRAQALQAQAAGAPLSVHMNPILLKPNSDTGAQVILQGQAIGQLNAQDYHRYKPRAANAVWDSFQKLSDQYDTLFVEGAGSPAEINLRQGDIANMGFAEQVDCPVILIADIDKGGVFAHIVGTLACLTPSERKRIQGFVINRFRGDITLLQDGLDWLEKRTRKPVLGVLPYLHDLKLDAEDAIAVTDVADTKTTRPGDFQDSTQRKFKIICPLLPHISNHTDMDPLQWHPDIDFQWVKHNAPIPPADLIILPGSKSVAFDLAWLKQQGWENALKRHLRYGGKVIGLCGGLQMLGYKIHDPDQLESSQAQIFGFGCFQYETTLKPRKQLKRHSGHLNFGSNAPISGYEIHQGETDFSGYAPALNWAYGLRDGALSKDNQILATYCHGLFDHPEGQKSLLEWAGLRDADAFHLDQHRETQLNRLADTLEQHLDIEKIDSILGQKA
jgi:adenosylcobyric acid synthase